MEEPADDSEVFRQNVSKDNVVLTALFDMPDVKLS